MPSVINPPLFFIQKNTSYLHQKACGDHLPFPSSAGTNPCFCSIAANRSFSLFCTKYSAYFATHPVVSTIHRPQLANLPRQRDSEHTSPLVHPDISTPKHSHSTNQPPPKKNNKKYSHFGCARMRLLHRPRARIEPVARGPANRPLLLVQCLGGRTVGHRHFNENWKH